MVTIYEGDFELDNVYDSLEDVKEHNGKGIEMGFEEALRHLKAGHKVKRRDWVEGEYLKIDYCEIGEDIKEEVEWVYVINKYNPDPYSPYTFFARHESLVAEDWMVL